MSGHLERAWTSLLLKGSDMTKDPTCRDETCLSHCRAYPVLEETCSGNVALDFQWRHEGKRGTGRTCGPQIQTPLVASVHHGPTFDTIVRSPPRQYCYKLSKSFRGDDQDRKVENAQATQDLRVATDSQYRMSIASTASNFSLVYLLESALRGCPDSVMHASAIGSMIIANMVASTLHYVDSIEQAVETNLGAWLTWIWPHATRGIGLQLSERRADGSLKLQGSDTLEPDHGIGSRIATLELQTTFLTFPESPAVCKSTSFEHPAFDMDAYDEIWWPTSLSVSPPLFPAVEVLSGMASVISNPESRNEYEQLNALDRTWKSVDLVFFAIFIPDVPLLLETYAWINWILFMMAWYLIYRALSHISMFASGSEIPDGPITDNSTIVTLHPYTLLEESPFSGASPIYNPSPVTALRTLRSMSALDTFPPIVSTSVISEHAAIETVIGPAGYPSDSTSTKRERPSRKSAIESLFERLLISNGRSPNTNRQAHLLPVVDTTAPDLDRSDDEATPTQSPQTPKANVLHLSWLNHSGSSSQSTLAGVDGDEELTPKASMHTPLAFIVPLSNAFPATNSTYKAKPVSDVERIQNAIDMRMRSIRAVQSRKLKQPTVSLADSAPPPPAHPLTPPPLPVARSLTPPLPPTGPRKSPGPKSKKVGLSASLWACDGTSEAEDEILLSIPDPKNINGYTTNDSSRSLDADVYNVPSSSSRSSSHSRSYSDSSMTQGSEQDGQEEGYLSDTRMITPRRRTLPLPSKFSSTWQEGGAYEETQPRSSNFITDRPQCLRLVRTHRHTYSEGNALAHIPAYTPLRSVAYQTFGRSSDAEMELELIGLGHRRELSNPPFSVASGHTSEQVSAQTTRFDTRLSPRSATFLHSSSSSPPFLRSRSHSFTTSRYSPILPTRDLTQPSGSSHCLAIVNQAKSSTPALSEPRPSSPIYSDLGNATTKDLPSFHFPTIAVPSMALNDSLSPPQQFTPLATSSPKFKSSTLHEAFPASIARASSLSPIAPSFVYGTTPAEGRTSSPSSSGYTTGTVSGGVYLGLQGSPSSRSEAPPSLDQLKSRYPTTLSPNSALNPAPASSNTRVSTFDWATDEPEPVEQWKKSRRGKRGGKKLKKKQAGEVNWALA